MSREPAPDIEIEHLLSGVPVANGDLAPLAELFGALRTGDGAELSEEAIVRFAAAAAGATSSAILDLAPSSRLRHRRPLGTLRRRAATVAIAATVVLGGTSGLAMAADGAKPGDALYGLDRALESVGIGAGGQHERLTEAEALVGAGEVQLGLEHAAEALTGEDDGSASASTALREAADRVTTVGSETSAETSDGVADLLSYLADNVGHVDGKQVAELAKEIGRSPDDDSTPPTNDESADSPDPADTPGNSPAEPPGLSNRDPDHPGNKPDSPPGLSGRDPGPPDDLPANPPSHTKPDRPDRDK